MNFWNKKKVLVTGADGFIGSWLAKSLVESRAVTIVVVRDLKTDNCLDLHNLREKVTQVQGDILDRELLKRVFKEYPINICFHLAAQTIVTVARRLPVSTFENNIKGTWNILEACRMSKTVKGLVVASSDKAYGQQEKLPYTEDQPLLGLYPYDASKACADILARCYFRTYGLPVAVTRNANTYGGGDLHMDRIVPGTIVSVLKGEIPIIRSDGTLTRDYMYIKDAVAGYLLLAENLEREEVRGEAFNFGTGKPVSVLKLFNKIIKLCGKKVKPKILNQAKCEIQDQYLSIGKAKKILGWRPKYNLDEGLKETIKWYKDYLKKV